MLAVNQLHVKGVSTELMRQLRIEAEAAETTLRAWVLGALRAACGLPADGEEFPRMGRPPKWLQREREQEELRRQRAEASLAICGDVHCGAGYWWRCKLPPNHTGECSPTPR